MPFMAEMPPQSGGRVKHGAPDSVHLAPGRGQRGPLDRAWMEWNLRSSVSLGAQRARAPTCARAAAHDGGGVRARAPTERRVHWGPERLIADELHVRKVTILDGAATWSPMREPAAGQAGQEVRQGLPRVQRPCARSRPMSGAWTGPSAGQSVTVTLDGQDYEALPEEVEVQQRAAEGYALAEDAGYLAALNITLSEDLVLEGLAREVVRRIQTMRRDADFEISDRIVVTYQGSKRSWSRPSRPTGLRERRDPGGRVAEQRTRPGRLQPELHDRRGGRGPQRPARRPLELELACATKKGRGRSRALFRCLTGGLTRGPGGGPDRARSDTRCRSRFPPGVRRVWPGWRGSRSPAAHPRP